MTKYEETMQIIRGICQKTDTAVLFYSAGGKDGIALLDMLSPVFKKVICYYMWFVPGLDHVKPYLAWAVKKYPNVEIRQIQHYQRDYYDRYGFFQFSEGNPDIKPRKVGEVEEMVRQETGIKWAFSGMKGVDGYMKRMRLLTFKKRNGTYITEKGMVYPLAKWTNKEVLKYIEMRNLVKPFVYNPKDVSQGFGVDLRSLLILRQRFPRDYQRTVREFPFCEKLIFDYENGILPHGQEKEVLEIIKRIETESEAE